MKCSICGRDLEDHEEDEDCTKVEVIIFPIGGVHGDEVPENAWAIGGCI